VFPIRIAFSARFDCVSRPLALPKEFTLRGEIIMSKLLKGFFLTLYQSFFARTFSGLIVA